MESDVSFEHLLALSDKASAQRHHEVAYHLLAAALHVADDSRNAGQMDEVIVRCERNRDSVDRSHHNIDSGHARRRGKIATARAKRAAANARDVIDRHARES